MIKQFQIYFTHFIFLQQYISQMSFVSIQDEVEAIFQSSTSQYVVHRDEQIQSLRKMMKLPIADQESIDIIKDVMRGIIYVESEMLTYKPCQIFIEHIVRNEANWAIRNLICYRNKNETEWENNAEKYRPQDFQYHKDEENELIWSIGKLWFELLTNKRLPSLKKISQEEIERQIQKNIKNIQIGAVLKTVLVKDKNERISFSELMTNNLFEIQNQEFQCSLIHFISKIQIIGNSKKSLEPFNPFEEKIFQRDLKETITICTLFEKVKNFIRGTFEVQEKEQIEFSLYLIDLKLYFRMKTFQELRESKRFDIVLLEDKQDYSNFIKRFLNLENSINRKRRKQKFSKFKTQYSFALCPIQKMDREQIYLQFKSYLSTYAKQLQVYKKDPKFYKWIIAILLVRCSDYVFSNARLHIFKGFVGNEKFNLEEVLEGLFNCESIEKLKELQKKIHEFYFS